MAQERRPQQQGGGRPQGPRGQAPPRVRLTPQEVRALFTLAGNRQMNTLAKGIGETLAQKGQRFNDLPVTTTQMRNIFNAFQRIAETWESTLRNERGDMEIQRALQSLDPQLTYLAGRETNQYRKRLLQDLTETLKHAVAEVLADPEPSRPDWKRRRDYYDTVVDFVEAITAYHRGIAGS